MTTIEELTEFATAHGLTLQQKGEVGFGRACVGLISPGSGYVDYNPRRMAGNFDELWPRDERLYAPAGVESYHKHDCFAVLCDDNEESYAAALDQLLAWVRHLKSQGDVYVERYSTGATGIQALMSGVTGYAIRLR